ncbi:MAG: twin-arginine translocase TatA/TatE family subunit [Candidatus Ancaeobacter aquaticus]|nr:twin-arginine translocase TatA/TatE family subunit [Candidatus Ancaeobacter aquaticus]
MPSWIGLPELIVILVIILLLFGAKKLPDMARSIGKSVKEFKKSVSDITDDEKENKSSGAEKKEDSSQKEEPRQENKG